MAEVVGKTVKRDRISETVRVKAPSGPLPTSAGERVAIGKARGVVRDLIPIRNQVIENVKKVSSATGPRAVYEVTIKHNNPRDTVGERELLPEEQRIWQEFRSKSESAYQPDVISVTQISTLYGLHETQSRQMVKTWVNEGLVTPYHNFNSARITEKGRETYLLPPK